MGEYTDRAGPIALSTSVGSPSTVLSAPGTALFSISGTSTNGQNTVTGLSSTTGLTAGLCVEGPGITVGTRIWQVIDSSSIRLTANAGAAAGAGTFTFYNCVIAREAYFTNTKRDEDALVTLGVNTSAADVTAKRFLSQVKVPAGDAIKRTIYVPIEGGSTPELIYGYAEAITGTASPAVNCMLGLWASP